MRGNNTVGNKSGNGRRRRRMEAKRGGGGGSGGGMEEGMRLDMTLSNVNYYDDGGLVEVMMCVC